MVGSFQFGWQLNETRHCILAKIYRRKHFLSPHHAFRCKDRSSPAFHHHPTLTPLYHMPHVNPRKHNVCDLFTVPPTVYLYLTPGCIYLLSASYQALTVFPVKHRLNHYGDVLAVRRQRERERAKERGGWKKKEKKKKKLLTPQTPLHSQ